MLFLLFSLTLFATNIVCYPFADEIHEFGVALNMTNVDVTVTYNAINMSFTQFLLLQPEHANITLYMSYGNNEPRETTINVDSDDGYDAAYLEVYNYVGVNESTISQRINQLSSETEVIQNEYGDYNIVLMYNVNTSLSGYGDENINKRYYSDDSWCYMGNNGKSRCNVSGCHHADCRKTAKPT